MKKISLYWQLFLQYIIPAIVWNFYNFKDALIVFLLINILFLIKSVYQRLIFHEYITRVLIEAEGFKYDDLTKAVKSVDDLDSDYMPSDEYNSYYEQIAEQVNARTWRDKSGFIDEVSKRNILSRFIHQKDGVLNDFISERILKEK